MLIHSLHKKYKEQIQLMQHQYTIWTSVETKYIKELSDPANAYYAFSYTTIKNQHR